jgi:hypothetical protein
MEKLNREVSTFSNRSPNDQQNTQKADIFFGAICSGRISSECFRRPINSGTNSTYYGSYSYSYSYSYTLWSID